jgi:CubicO group peptidase (beta-lactamase class C family)
MRKTTFSTLDGSLPDPSNGAQSTADDYFHFLQMLLNNGSYRGVQILSKASVKELRKMHTTPEQMKYAPKTTEGFGYALGSWVVDEGKDNMANALACPSLYGTFPMVDWCRGYAYLLLTKSSSKDEQKKDVYLQMKDAVDEKLPSKCKE